MRMVGIVAGASRCRFLRVGSIVLGNEIGQAAARQQLQMYCMVLGVHVASLQHFSERLVLPLETGFSHRVVRLRATLLSKKRIPKKKKSLQQRKG